MYFYAEISQAYPHEVICDERSYKVLLHDEVFCHAPQSKGDLYTALVVVADEVQYRYVLFPFVFSETSTELLDKYRLRVSRPEEQHHVHSRDVYTLIQDINGKENL